MALGRMATLSGVLPMLGLSQMGLVPHHGSRNLGLLILGFTLCALGAHIALRRQQVQVLAPQ